MVDTIKNPLPNLAGAKVRIARTYFPTVGGRKPRTQTTCRLFTKMKNIHFAKRRDEGGTNKKLS